MFIDSRALNLAVRTGSAEVDFDEETSTYLQPLVLVVCLKLTFDAFTM